MFTPTPQSTTRFLPCQRLVRWLAALLIVITTQSMAVAAASPSFNATTSGSTTAMTITASLTVSDADRGQVGNLYLLASLNGAWIASTPRGWQPWAGGTLPVHASGVLTDQTIEVARGLDTSTLAGTVLYLGYGLNESDMLANAKYRQVLRIATPLTQARSALARSVTVVPDADASALTTGNTSFAFDLYRTLAADGSNADRNLFYSPLSISTALAMTYAGARGQTASEMASALRFGLAPERLHPAFGWLDQELTKRGQGSLGKDGQPFRLAVSNSLWADKKAQFDNAFLDTLGQYYGAGINLLDFQMAPDPSRVRINDWVSDKTEGRIQNLIPEGGVSSLTRLVLVNAVYFNAAWQQKFNKGATQSKPFTRQDGNQATVPMMTQDAVFGYVSTNTYQALELPYDGGELAMMIILPGAGRFGSFESTLDASVVSTLSKSLTSQYVRLTLPKFKIEGGFSLSAAMKSLGMRTAFSDAADFSGISPGESLRIQDVFHKGFVDVDENGTEAAAATAVVVGVTSVPAPPTIEFNANRPFVFAIVDKKTGAVVFLGRVVSPG
jgi:serpin B